MFEINFEVNGRRVTPEQFPDAFADVLTRVAINRVKETIQNTLADVRCPIHNLPLSSVTIVVNSLENMTVTFEGCCDEIIQVANKALGAE